MKKINLNYFRNFVFGAEDSLVSTVGVLFGIATAGTSKLQMIITGLIVISVEAVSMGAGAFLSESSTNEVENITSTDNPIISGIIMFFSYLITGFIPVAPFFLFEPETGKYYSVLISIISLFFLGYLPNKNARSAARMVIIATAAIIIGFIVAKIPNFMLL